MSVLIMGLDFEASFQQIFHIYNSTKDPGQFLRKLLPQYLGMFHKYQLNFIIISSNLLRSFPPIFFLL